MEKIKCIGCGAVLQTLDSKKPGYIPETAFNKGNFEKMLCKRCHAIKNYNFIEKNDTPIEEYRKILNAISKKDALFVYVVDVFSLDSTLNSEVIQYIKTHDIILVVNKFDLLPKSVKENKISMYVRKYAKDLGLRVRELIVTSMKNKMNVDEVINTIDEYRKGRNVYVLGATNVGKSSLMNAMLRASGMLDYDLITTSLIPATTMNLIEIPFFENGILYDTPGLVNPSNILSIAKATDFKYIMPKNEIKARIYQLESGQSLFLGGFMRMDFTEGNDNVFVLYASNALDVHRTKTIKAVEIMNGRMHELFTFDSDFEYEKHNIVIKEPKEVVIEGLGFISVKNPNCKLEVYVPAGCGVSVREPLIG